MKRFLPIALAAFVLAGCVDQKAWIQKLAPKDDDQFARQFIESVRHAQYVEASRMLDVAVATQAGANGLSQLHAVLDHGDPINIELIGANVMFLKPWNGVSKRQTNLTYQLRFKDAWVLAAFVIESSGSDRHFSGVNFQPLPTSLEYLNRFTVDNKTPIHLAFLVACIAVPLLIIVTLVVCLFSRVRRRWLWAIFILFGLTQFQLNWSTGQTAFQPISFLVLGASFFRAGLYAPIVFNFGVPLGAIVFLALRRWLLIRDDSSDMLASSSAGQQRSG
jgi:hypothetical protein